MITQLAFLLQAAAETTAPAAGVAAAAAPVVSNPYGLGALWMQGDFVAKTTLIILVVMSMGTWYILITKLWDQHRVMRHSKQVGGSFWKAGSLKDAAAKLPAVNTFRGIVDDGLAAADQTKGYLTDKIDQSEWISISVLRSVELITNRLKEGMTFLATVGSAAPFVGLFGTVWGIYHALIAIGIAGQASIDKVAGPVGEALIMTAIGLAVAVPAVLAYNWLLSRNKVALEDVRNFAADVEAYLVTSVDKKATTAK